MGAFTNAHTKLRMGKVKNNDQVELINLNGRALCSNSPEGGGASLGDAKTFPQFSWLLEHQEDKLYFRSGAKIRFSALDNGCGDRGRFMCSNCDGLGYSYTGDAETGNTYGWE